MACDMCGGSEFAMLGMRLNRSQGYSPKTVSGIAVSVKQCGDCGLIFADPLPIPENLSDHYGIPPEEYWHEPNMGVEDPHTVLSVKHAKRLLGDRTSPTALDVGAGLGQTMRLLYREVFDAYGIEPSEPFHQRLDASRVQLATAEGAEFPDDSFDFITFDAVLEHLYSPSLAISRALKWLKPGGIIHASVPNANWLIAALINRYFRLRGTNYVTHLSPMHVPFHLYEFREESFRQNGQRLGYELADVRFDTCVVNRVPMRPLFRWYMDRANRGMMITVFLRKPG